jgi:hypothetical protein
MIYIYTPYMWLLTLTHTTLFTTCKILMFLEMIDINFIYLFLWCPQGTHWLSQELKKKFKKIYENLLTFVRNSMSSYLACSRNDGSLASGSGSHYFGDTPTLSCYSSEQTCVSKTQGPSCYSNGKKGERIERPPSVPRA